MLLRSMYGIRGIKLDIRALSWRKMKEKEKSLRKWFFAQKPYVVML